MFLILCFLHGVLLRILEQKYSWLKNKYVYVRFFNYASNFEFEIDWSSKNRNQREPFSKEVWQDKDDI